MELLILLISFSDIQMFLDIHTDDYVFNECDKQWNSKYVANFPVGSMGGSSQYDSNILPIAAETKPFSQKRKMFELILMFDCLSFVLLCPGIEFSPKAEAGYNQRMEQCKYLIRELVMYCSSRKKSSGSKTQYLEL